MVLGCAVAPFTHLPVYPYPFFTLGAPRSAICSFLIHYFVNQELLFTNSTSSSTLAKASPTTVSAAP
jgi:hypothetical protein